MSVQVALIGGTGVYRGNMTGDVREEQVATPYGNVKVYTGFLEDRRVAFLPRHGERHQIPPHRINYRANIYALAVLGVERIFATNAVGSLHEPMAPGHLVLADQFLDFTHGRKSTFFEGDEEGVYHVDVTEPYCPQCREILSETADSLGIPLHPRATYACTEGPRFETPAEIRMIKQVGGDLVGMTSVPEVVLAREAGICYASLCMVTNYAAGVAAHPLSQDEVASVLQENLATIHRLLGKTISRLPHTRTCGCRSAAPLQNRLQKGLAGGEEASP